MGIQPKKKTCSECGNLDFIFSKGRCKACAGKAYQAKAKEKASQIVDLALRLSRNIKTPKPLKQAKRCPLSNVPTKRHKVAKDAERVVMETFWILHTDKNGCVCEECSAGVPTEFNPYNCAHILGKGAAPQHRANIENFLLLCADCHHQFDAGSRHEMKVWAKAETIILKLKNS
jgi:hypothetical protein